MNRIHEILIEAIEQEILKRHGYLKKAKDSHATSMNKEKENY